MITALDFVGRIITSAAVGRVLSAVGRAALRAGAREILSHARSTRPRYSSKRVRRDRA